MFLFEVKTYWYQLYLYAYLAWVRVETWEEAFEKRPLKKVVKKGKAEKSLETSSSL